MSGDPKKIWPREAARLLAALAVAWVLVAGLTLSLFLKYGWSLPGLIGGGALGILGVATWAVPRLIRRQANDFIEINKLLGETVDEARRAAEVKGEFLANMSHEIRTPMNGILGMTELVLSSDLNPEQRDYLETVRSSGTTLLTIINDILDFSKIESGRMSLEEAPYAPQEMVTGVLRLLTLTAEQKGVALVSVLDPGLPNSIIGDRHRVSQILLNLVSNSIKFTEPGGRVEIRLQAAGEQLVLEVQDSGIGIAPEKLHAIFEPFTQADASTTRRFGGTGLGLTICSRLTTLMGGSIAASSTPQVGTVFTVTLPLRAATTPEPAAQPAAARTAAGARPLEILLVEDNIVNQRLTRAILERRGHRVTVVADGEEALRCALETRFDLMLLDVHMPVMDGFEAITLLREREQAEGTHLPVIAITAKAMAGDRERCLAAGMDEYIAKPIVLAELFAAIERLTRRPASAGQGTMSGC